MIAQTSLLAERVWMLSPDDLSMWHWRFCEVEPPEAKVLARSNVKHAITNRYTDSYARFLVAMRVAGAIVARWQDAGIRRWYRDQLGFPVPLLPNQEASTTHFGVPEYIVHASRFVYRTSPSGKSLFGCVHCDDVTVLPVSPCDARGRCTGKRLGSASHHVALALFAGADYQPNEHGLPVPALWQDTARRLGAASQIRWCWCCGLFGPWTLKESVGDQIVCKPCFIEVQEIFRSVSFKAPFEVKAARDGRDPY